MNIIKLIDHLELENDFVFDKHIDPVDLINFQTPVLNRLLFLTDGLNTLTIEFMRQTGFICAF